MCFKHIYRSRHVRLDSVEAGLLMTHPGPPTGPGISFTRAAMTDIEQYKTPLRLFRQGMDTLQIEKELGCSEATAYNLIHRAKEAERDGRGKQSANYWRNSHTRDLKPYAGKEIA
jgi:hypothetical protein